MLKRKTVRAELDKQEGKEGRSPSTGEETTNAVEQFGASFPFDFLMTII